MWRMMTGSNVRFKQPKNSEKRRPSSTRDTKNKKIDVKTGDKSISDINSSKSEDSFLNKTVRKTRKKNALKKDGNDSSQMSSCSQEESTPRMNSSLRKSNRRTSEQTSDHTSDSAITSPSNQPRIIRNKNDVKKDASDSSLSKKEIKAMVESTEKIADTAKRTVTTPIQNKKIKVLREKMKLRQKLKKKQKKKLLSKKVEMLSSKGANDVNELIVVVSDCEGGKEPPKKIKTETIDTCEENISSQLEKEVEKVMDCKKSKLTKDKLSKRKSAYEKNQEKTIKDPEETTVKITDSAECTVTTPMQSTLLSVKTETPNTPCHDDSIRSDTSMTSLEISMNNQSVYSDKKKRKIGKKDDKDITVSITEEYYSTQDESVDETLYQKEQDVVHGSTKRKRKDRKYRKKKKDKQYNADSDKVEDDSNVANNSASKLEVDIGVLDIRNEPMEDEVLPEDVRYIPVDFPDMHGILFLSQNQVVAMKGCMQLCVIYGQADISGYKLVPGKPYIDVFSVTSSSLFYIKDNTPSACTVELKEKLFEVLVKMFDTTKEKLIELVGELNDIYACVVVKRMYSLLPALMRKLNNYRGFAREPEFLPQPFKTGVLETGQWEVLFNEIQGEMEATKDDCTCSMMLCGATNVGKSSMARYVINRLLEKHESVFFLDCDCGQSEFTPPSVLSLVKVTKPLVGLPFTHQMTPVRSFFYGHISPGDTPSEYIKLIGYLFQTYYVDYFSAGPLVINTQGWMQGLGLSLLVDVIRITSPCHIVHISGHNAKSNVPKELNDEFLQKEDGWDTETTYNCMKKGHGCKYHNLSTTDVQKKFKSGKNSRNTRDQCITSYFSKLYQPYLDHAIANGEKYEDWVPPAMSVIMPYIVRWQDVALHIMHETVTSDVMLFGFNFALVGLARVDPELIQARTEETDDPNYLLDVPVAEYIGLGIVRNIDPTKKLFYIISPEPVERLLTVNAILRGSAQMPSSYFVEDIHSNQPYYCMDYINLDTKTTGGMKPRYNLKRKPSKMRTSIE